MIQPNNENSFLQASDIAIARLSRYSSRGENSIRQTFIMTNEHLTGIRFETGLFRADWNFEENYIEFKRGPQLIEKHLLDLPGQSDTFIRKAA